MVQTDPAGHDKTSLSAIDLMGDPRLLKEINPFHLQILRGLPTDHQLLAVRALDTQMVKPNSMEWDLLLSILQAQGLEVKMRKLRGEDVVLFKFPVRDQEGKPDGHYSIILKGYNLQQPDEVDFEHLKANSQYPDNRSKTPQFANQYSLCLLQTKSLQNDNLVPVLGMRVLPNKEATQDCLWI